MTNELYEAPQVWQSILERYITSREVRTPQERIGYELRKYNYLYNPQGKDDLVNEMNGYQLAYYSMRLLALRVAAHGGIPYSCSFKISWPERRGQEDLAMFLSGLVESFEALGVFQLYASMQLGTTFAIESDLVAYVETNLPILKMNEGDPLWLVALPGYSAAGEVLLAMKSLADSLSIEEKETLITATLVPPASLFIATALRRAEIPFKAWLLDSGIQNVLSNFEPGYLAITPRVLPGERQLERIADLFKGDVKKWIYESAEPQLLWCCAEKNLVLVKSMLMHYHNLELLEIGHVSVVQ